jgi:hypothetical protein
MQDLEIRLSVADMIVLLRSGPGVRVVGHVDSFLVDGQPEATVNVRLACGSDWTMEWRRVSTGKNLGWNAFRTPDGEWIQVERLGGDLVRFASERECQVVDLLLNRPDDGSERELLLVETLPLPVVVLLSGRGGVFLHSCAVALGEAGVLFAGVSGSGKSTMAELWRRFGPSRSRVIDDEHIIARSSPESTVLFGAPWSRGTSRAVFSRTPLKVIFFLSHGEQNKCVRLSSTEAFAHLLSQVFLPVWSQEQVELTMQTCADMLGGVDCYHLQFVPDSEVVGFIQEFLGESQ